MTFAYDLTLWVYNLTLIPIIFFSVLFLIFSFINLFIDKKEKKHYRLKEYPFVSVQIPTFNDPIAQRCIQKCMNFDYPKDKYEIVIVDDSTNEKTQDLLKSFADENPNFIKYIHRTNREGFKPGALKNAMKITKGEVLVIFDSDWIPKPDFLKKVVKPFADPKVAVVQTRQDFYNKDTNLITRFAAYLLMVYHTIVMPINNKINNVFFCGTAGAIRRSAFDRVGGWNANSITEDSELTVNLLLKGYKTVYLKMGTLSEVPDTFESFVKQQMRWCYGNVRVFIDNSDKILWSNKLSIFQKMMITYVTMGNVIAPMVILMTFFGFAGWFLGDPTLLSLGDVVDLIAKSALTAGFIIMGAITLKKQKALKELPYMIISVFTVGVVLAAGNTYAFIKAILNKNLHWYCTPKNENENVVKE
jgi:cellulose synthase/poly-beta-1,6-N-acetylglucosamine synthase-like glycosyltransferase